MSHVPFSSDERLRELLPGWMLRAGREHWRAFGKATMRVMDNVLDSMLRASLAAMPLQVDASDYAAGGPAPNVDALPYIGRNRGLRPGKHEPAHMYAARLRDWHEAKRTAGTPGGLLHALRAVLAPTPPKVRLVRGGYPGAGEGYWWTLDDTGLRYQTWEGKGVFWPADGSAPVADATVAHAWDWDSEYWYPPEPIPDPSRLWAIIYAPVTPELTTFEGQFGDGLSVYGEKDANGDKLTTGTTATAPYVETVRAVCEDFKAAGCTVSHVVVTLTSTLFDPADPGSLNWPDGWWKYHGKIIDDAGTLRRVRARTTRARYWKGTRTIHGTNPGTV